MFTGFCTANSVMLPNLISMVTPSPPIDDICAVMIVWRMSENIVRTVAISVLYWQYFMIQ